MRNPFDRQASSGKVSRVLRPARWLGHGLAVAIPLAAMLAAATLAVVILMARSNGGTASVAGNDSETKCDIRLFTDRGPTREGAIVSGINTMTYEQPATVAPELQGRLRPATVTDVRARRVTGAEADKRMREAEGGSGHGIVPYPNRLVWLVSMEGLAPAGLMRWSTDSQGGAISGGLVKNYGEALPEKYLYEFHSECLRHLFDIAPKSIKMREGEIEYEVTPDSNVFPLYTYVLEHALSTARAQRTIIALPGTDSAKETSSSIPIEITYPAPGIEVQGLDGLYTKVRFEVGLNSSVQRNVTVTLSNGGSTTVAFVPKGRDTDNLAWMVGATYRLLQRVSPNRQQLPSPVLVPPLQTPYTHLPLPRTTPPQG